jgi:hypothetical protein
MGMAMDPGMGPAVKQKVMEGASGFVWEWTRCTGQVDRGFICWPIAVSGQNGQAARASVHSLNHEHATRTYMLHMQEAVQRPFRCEPMQSLIHVALTFPHSNPSNSDMPPVPVRVFVPIPAHLPSPATPTYQSLHLYRGDLATQACHSADTQRHQRHRRDLCDWVGA